jgi:hypothetical protein
MLMDDQTDRAAPAAVVRAKLMEGRSSLPDFAAGIGKSEQAVRIYARQGMPIERVGQTPYVPIEPALAWLRDRGKRNASPPPRRPGRPSRNATA